MKWSSFCFLATALTASALNLPQRPRALTRRGTGGTFHVANNNPNNILLSTTPGESSIVDKSDNIYISNVTFSGQDVPMVLDTGSSDLWIFPEQFPGALTSATNYSNITVEVQYGKGYVSGFLSVMDIDFAGYTITKQAFITVTEHDMQDLFDIGVFGIVGLSFDSESEVDNQVKENFGIDTTWGQTVLSNVFTSHPNDPDFISFALERSGDLDGSADGTFTIGVYDERYAAVNSTTPLPNFQPPEQTFPRWEVFVDAFTLGGNAISLPTSGIPTVPAGKLAALLDTGTSLAYIPDYITDAIYSSIDGSAYSPDDGNWYIPCLSDPTLSITIGGQTIPIHPLDLSAPVVLSDDADNSFTYCTGSYARISDLVGVNADLTPYGFDMILGDSFLRNVYSVYNFGEGSTPSIQLLAVTNASDANADFLTVRQAALALLPPLGDISKITDSIPGGSSSNSTVPPPPPADSSSNNTDSTSNDFNNLALDSNPITGLPDDFVETFNKIKSYGPIVLALLGVIALLLLLLSALTCAFLCRRRTVTKSAKKGLVYEPVSLADKDAEGKGFKNYEETSYTGTRYRDDQ